MSKIKPHSSEWFEALMKLDHQKAMMTGQLVKLAGTSNCCSFCGDIDGIRDYELLPNPDLPAGFTFKGCNDCIRIRSEQFGEKYSPIED